MMWTLLVCFTLSSLANQAAAGQGFGLAPVAELSGPRILVAPFEPPGRDGRTYWLGHAVSILLTDDLNARGLSTITRGARERAYEQLHLPPNAVLSRATVIRVGQLVGAAHVIVGEVQLQGDALTVRARPIRIDVGRADVEITERGELKDLVSLVQRVARRAAPGGDLTTAHAPTLQAFEQFVKGLLAGQPATQASFLDTALKLDPSYDQTRLQLWEVRTAQGDHAAALAAVRDVAGASAFARRARFRSAISLVGLQRYDEAFGILKALQEEREEAAILNNLAIVQLRRGSTAETGKPAYFLNKAVKLEGNDADYLFNLGYAYALERDPQAAIYWLREALRRNPADAEAHVVLATALEGAGRGLEADRERELAGQLSARYAESPRRSGDTPPRGLERLREYLESHSELDVDQAIVSTTQRDQQDAAQFHLDRARRLFEDEQDREAMAELRRAVFLSPYEAEAHLLIGRIHLRAGRPRDAVAALTISIWSRDSAPAHVALAQAYLQLRDTAAARAQVERALSLDPSSATAKQLQARIERGGGLP